MTANIRKWFYLFSGLATALVPILVSLNITTVTASEQWIQLLTVVGGIIGAGGLGTAAVVVNKQQKNGTLDKTSPADQVINNIPVVVQTATDALSELDRVRKVASDALNQVPVLGPLATQIINSVRL